MAAPEAIIQALIDAIRGRSDAGNVSAKLAFGDPDGEIVSIPGWDDKPRGLAWGFDQPMQLYATGIADWIYDSILRFIVPEYTIVAYNGGISIPDGWALCDGTNGTPDLRDRFVRGGTAPGATGGNDGSNHYHSIEHDHAAFTSGNPSVNDTGGSNPLSTGNPSAGDSGGANPTTTGGSSAANTGAAGSHFHLTASGFDDDYLYWAGTDASDLPRYGSTTLTTRRASSPKGLESYDPLRLAHTETIADHVHSMAHTHEHVHVHSISHTHEHTHVHSLAHTHEINPPNYTGNSGETNPDNRPAFYTLVYIMKLPY